MQSQNGGEALLDRRDKHSAPPKCEDARRSRPLDLQPWDGTATSISYHVITEISQYHIMGIMDLRLSIMESKYHIMYPDIHATLHV